MLDSLYAWRAEWDLDNRNSPKEVQLATFTTVKPMRQPLEESSPLTTVFEFSNNTSAGILMLYNTARSIFFKSSSRFHAEPPTATSLIRSAVRTAPRSPSMTG
jgi:hypothetical protein